jgi:beta-glucosidase
MTHDGGATDDAGRSERVESLLGRMTTTEKARQLVGTYVGTLGGDQQTTDDVADVVRDGGLGAVSPFGVGCSPYDDPAEAAAVANRLQRVAVEETRLGVPLLVPVDAIHGHAYVRGATVFPHNLGVAAARDPALAETCGRVTAAEMAATGATQNYGPTCDVGRDPRWGRIFETYGESPFLCSRFAAAKVRGLQGDDVSDGDSVAAMAKHFPAYGDPDRGEDAAPVEISASTLSRDFLPPFEAAVVEGVAAVMPSYNSVDSEPSHGSRRYLTGLLRDELGFEGYVASDWNGVRMLHEDHRTAPSMREACRQATAAGVDLHSLGAPDHADHLVSLVEAGELDEGRLDEAAGRVLSLKERLGLFDDPYVDAGDAPGALGTRSHREAALEAARKSMTLLKNDGVLPFSPDVDEVFVGGPNADELESQLGGWSVFDFDEGTVPGTTVYEGVERRVSDETAVTYERGAALDERLDVEAAASKAEDADAAVVVLGEGWYLHEFGPTETTGDPDGFPTREDLTLPDAQRALLEAVVETGTPTALVFVTGRPLAHPWAADHVPAILQAYYPGTDGGRAVAETLFGEVNPSGTLPVSVPRSAEQLPQRHDYLPHPHPIGDDAHRPSYDPQWPFGHGESYTEFDYRALDVDDATTADETVTARVTLANVGDREGTEAVHLYARDEYASRVTPARELRAVERVPLDPGEERTVELAVDVESLGVVGADGRRHVELGAFTFTLSADEDADLPTATAEVSAADD